jgi:hypothetical protein
MGEMVPGPFLMTRAQGMRFSNLGILAAGCPEEAERAWLEDWRLKQQCLEWEMHVRSEGLYLRCAHAHARAERFQ